MIGAREIMRSKLDKYQIAEFKDLWDGSYQGLKQLARHFKVSIDCMRWFVDYQDHRKRQSARIKAWQLKNPERLKKICQRSGKAYWKRKKLGLGPILHNHG